MNMPYGERSCEIARVFLPAMISSTGRFVYWATIVASAAPPIARPLSNWITGPRCLTVEETELCCGAAGTYNLTQPEMSERLGKRKMDHIAATGADVVAMGNVGCILQVARQVKERGSPIEVAHPVDLLDRAYRGNDAAGTPKNLTGWHSPG